MHVVVTDAPPCQHIECDGSVQEDLVSLADSWCSTSCPQATMHQSRSWT